jgi:hypothetical protein
MDTHYTPKEANDRAIAENAARSLVSEALSEIYQANTESEALTALYLAITKAFQQPHRDSATAGIVLGLFPTLAQAISHPSNFVGSAPGEYVSNCSEKYWPELNDAPIYPDYFPGEFGIDGLSAICPHCGAIAEYPDCTHCGKLLSGEVQF